MKKILSLVLAVCLTAAAALTAFAAGTDDWRAKWDDAVSDSAVIALSPGETEAEMRFAWLSDVTARNAFALSPSPEMRDAVSLPVDVRLTVTGQKRCRVTADGLLPDTTYYYRYTKNGRWSDVYSFRTQGNTLTALFVSDAQLGRSGDRRSKEVLLHDVAGWDTTLAQSTALYPDVSLILSAGDQAEVAYSEQEYRLLLSPDTLRSVPIAPIIGNHEFYFPYLNLHFNLPHRIGGSIVHSLGDEPYFFLRGNTLFIQLDSNDSVAWDHEAVLDRAIRAYPEAEWRVVMMHHSLYSCENDENDDFLLRRTLTPLLQKYNVNLVLSGHTHRYSRSFPLTDGVKSENGVTYLEGGCSSACNSKASPETLPAYSAAGYPKAGNAVYSVLEFMDDAIRIHAYAVEDGESVEIDSGTVKAVPRDDTNAHMPRFLRALQAVLSLCGRLVSVLFR